MGIRSSLLVINNKDNDVSQPRGWIPNLEIRRHSFFRSPPLASGITYSQCLLEKVCLLQQMGDTFAEALLSKEWKRASFDFEVG